MPSVTTSLTSLDIVEACPSEKGSLGRPFPSPINSVPTWALTSRLQPLEKAAFAVSSRLLASIVTESLLRAYYIPLDSQEARGVCVVLSTHVIGELPVLTRPLRPADIFAILPLHHEPVFSGSFTKHGRKVWLLDPLDMVPSIFELSTKEFGQDDCVRWDSINATNKLLIHYSPPFRR
jgi:hypothetical protein